MKILVACEESQAVTIELRRLGHEAYSCDIIECSGGHPEWHIDQLFYLAGKALRQQETVANRNGLNTPLTLDELRKMDGEPVYCVEITGREEWLFRRDGGFADMYGEFTSDDFMVFDNYGKLWWCYRQKPEDGTV